MNAYQVVRDFENAIAEYTSAPYAISVDSCSTALFFCCLYCNVKDYNEIVIPKYTYPSAPAAVVHAGGKILFKDFNWQRSGYYYLEPTVIIDSAKRLFKNMYYPNYYICLSFHGKKILPIGRGGMILTDNKKAADWFKTARFDGRHECNLDNDTLAMAGWNAYMTPEQAARGLELFQWLPDDNISPPDKYQDLSKYKFYTEANR